MKKRENLVELSVESIESDLIRKRFVSVTHRSFTGSNGCVSRVLIVDQTSAKVNIHKVFHFLKTMNKV